MECSMARSGSKPCFIKTLPPRIEISPGRTLKASCIVGEHLSRRPKASEDACKSGPSRHERRRSSTKLQLKDVTKVYGYSEETWEIRAQIEEEEGVRNIEIEDDPFDSAEVNEVKSVKKVNGVYQVNGINGKIGTNGLLDGYSSDSTSSSQVSGYGSMKGSSEHIGKQDSGESLVCSPPDSRQSSREYLVSPPGSVQGSREYLVSPSDSAQCSMDYILHSMESMNNLNSSREYLVSPADSTQGSREYLISPPNLAECSTESLLSTSDSMRSSREYLVSPPLSTETLVRGRHDSTEREHSCSSSQRYESVERERSYSSSSMHELVEYSYRRGRRASVDSIGSQRSSRQSSVERQLGSRRGSVGSRSSRHSSVERQLGKSKLPASKAKKMTAAYHRKSKRVGRPSPPETLEVTKLTPTAATISWTAPEDDGGCEVTHYTLEKKESGQKKWEALTTLPACVMECELENMTADKEYYVRVRAANKMGLGDPQYLKSSITVQGMQLGVPAKPGPPTISEICDNSMTVMWEAPTSDGGCPIKRYILDMREIRGPGRVTTTKCVSRGPPYVVKNLLQDAEYEFRIYAENSQGLSQPSEALGPVICKSLIKVEAPKFIGDMLDASCTEGGKAQFQVKVTGLPPPDVRWFKNFREVFDGYKHRVEKEENVCTMVILNVTKEDVGEVECRAYNRIGSTSIRAKLILQVPAKIRLSPRMYDGLSFSRGQTFKLKIPYIGYPSPKITWVKDGELLVKCERFEMSDRDNYATLFVHDCNKTDCGSYTLEVENPLGRDEKTFDVAITDRPDPPGRPTVSEIKGESAELEWEAPAHDGGSYITNYCIERREGAHGRWMRLGSSHFKHMTVHDLKENRVYYFRVFAENLYGLSDPSDETAPVTLHDQQKVDIDYDTLVDMNFTFVNVNVERLRGDINTKYIICEELGRGAFGVVHRAVERATGKNWAAKFVPCRYDDKDDIKEEIELMNSLHHPKLLQLHEAFEQSGQMVMVLELLSGGDLFERLVDADYVLTELDCIHYIRQVCQGVAHLHKNNIIHLDLKPENILCMTRNSKDIKIIDFGLAHRVDPDKIIQILFGTPEFCAPEIISYDPVSFSTDMWSLGVLAYVLLTGLSPFLGESDLQTFAYITKAEYDFEDEVWDSISQDAMDWISRIFVKDRRLRMTITEALAHPWLNGTAEAHLPSVRLSTVNHRDVLARQHWRNESEQVIAIGRLGTISPIFRRLSQRGVFERELAMELPDHAPQVVMELNNTEAQAGNVGRFKCKVIGQPAPVITWYHEECKLREDDFKYDMWFKRGVATLSVNDCGYYDIGQYSCVATNELGECITVGELHVQDVQWKRRLSFDGGHRPSLEGGRRTSVEMNRLRRSLSIDRDFGLRDLNIPPLFTLPLMDQALQTGEDVVFSVTVAANPAPEVTWFHRSQIFPSPKYTIESEKDGVHRLTVRNIDDSDAGQWKAMATNNLGRTSCSCMMTVIKKLPENYVAPRFAQGIEKTVIIEGSAARFDCRVTGSPEPEIWWFKDRKAIQDGYHYEMLFEEQDQCSLVIQEAFPEDSGFYMCRASNAAGTAYSEAQLKVQGLDYDDYAKIPRSQRSSVSSVDSGGTGTVRRQKFDSAPNFTAKLRPKSCREGWSVKFNCSVTGVPTPEVKWFKGAHPVQNSDRVKLANNYGLLSLEINNVQQDDAGTYSVHASNSEGEATCKASLEVKEAEKEAPREETGKRPRFIYEPRSTGVEEGKKVTLEAQATGKPMPDFTWEKDNKVVEEDDRVKVFSDSDGNTKLVIKEATPKDAGLYFCIASNDAGKSKCTATLRVSEKKPEKPKGKEPWFVKKLSKSVDIGEGETLVLECEIDGDPKPVVQWMRGVREIQYSKRHRVVGTGTKQVLEIDSFLATDAGEYTVQAENNLGQITGSCQVTFVPKQQEEVVDEEDYVDIYDSEFDDSAPFRQAPKFTQPLPLEAEVVAGENLEVEVKVNVDQQEEPPAPAYEEATEEASISLALEPEPEPVAAVEETEEAAMTFQLDSEEAAATFELADEEAEATMQLEEEEAAATFQLDAGMEGDAVGADMTLEVDQEEASGTFQLGGAPEPDGIAPEFTLKLKGKKVKIDSIAKLTVKVNAMPTPTVTWAKDGETITDGGRYEMFPEEDSYNLEIYDTEPGDSGTYSCTVTNDLGSATSSCELLVEGEKKKKTKTGEKEKKKKKGKDEPEEEKAKGDNPRFTETVKDVVTEEGQAASFSCKTAGKPDPEISWTKEGKPCKSTKRVKMSSKKGVHTLTISAVQKKDVGKYVCTAASSAGTASCSATLSIQDVTETSSTVTESTPKYEKTETKTSKTVTVSSGGGGTKTETQTKKTVTVSGSSGGGTQELEISKALKNLSLDEGKNVSLECKVGPDPLTTEAEAFWIRDGQEIIASERIKITSDPDGTHKLNISPTREDDTGFYACVLRCGGKEVTTSANLVVSAPKSNEDMSHRTGSGARSGLMSSRIRKPVFTQELENKKCSDGEKVTLECRVTSNTRPQVSWHKDGKQLRQSKDFKMFFDGELARLDIVEAFLDDEGEYCCKATSPFGEAKTSCRLSVKDGNIPASKPPPKSLVSKAEPKTETKMDIKLKSTAREESKLKSPSREELRTEGRLKSATSREDVKLDLKVRTSPRDTKPQQNGARPKGVKAMASRSHLLDDKRRNYTKEVKPSFIIKPRRQFVDDGLVAKFKASFDGSPAPEISWEKEGKTIPNSGRYRYFKERDFHYLEISDVTVDDKGTYVCVIQNSVGRETASAELDVYVRKTTRKKNPPKFDIPLKDKKVPDGESLTLECLISGSPEPTVSWYLSGKVLKSSEDIKQTFDGKTAKLVFVEVFPDDEGTYECVATNANGEVRCKCKLTVEDPKPAGTAPSISSGLSDQVSHDGDKVVFTCTIQGQPEPEIKWFKAGKQIKENQDFKMMFDGTIAKLEIMEVFPEDDGDYACVATNAFGEDKSKCKLTVKDPEPKVKPKPKAPEPAPKTTKSVSKEPPKFATELKNITVNDGDKVEMTVKVTGTPPIDICWLHGDKEVKKTDPVYQLKSQGQFHTLTVPEVYPEDAGTYICEAYNDYGDTDTMCTLTVRDKAAAATSAIANQNGVQPVENDMANDIEAEEDIENEFYPPEFIRKPKSASVDEGNSAKFSCQIGGNPAPHVTWEKDGKPLTNGGRFKIASDGILRTFEISHTLATDAGRYGIRAKNTEGVEKYSVSLMVKELENSENLDFRSLLKARPSLGKIGSSSSTESEKEAEQHDFRAVLTRHVKTKERPTIKQELEDVRATEGDSVTLECRISGVPKPKLIWYLGKKEIKESKFFKMSYEGSMARLVIAEVYPEDEGEYTVKATNDAGTAKSSCDVYVQDLPMEDSPRDRRASSSQGPGVQEEPPFIEEISPENVHVLRGSKVQIRAKFCGEPGPTVVWMKGKKEIPSGGAVKIDIIRDTTVLTIQNVQPDHSGRYTLCLESPLGSDRAAVSVTVEDKPNAPSGKPHASTVTKNSMTLSWYGPSYDGGSVVSDYRVEICKGPDGDWKTLTSSCKSTSYSVKSLEPNAEYIFRISAANKHGFSEPGQESDVYVTTDRRPSGWQENDPAPSRTDGKQADDTLIIPRNVAIDPNRNFSDHYLLKEEIGKGRFGNVYRCMEKESGREWAAKFIKVKLGDKSETKNEIDVMNSLRHSKLLMLWDAFESKREMVLVMEHVAGGELFERIIDEDYILTERECVHFMKQICDAIKYMHDENILHLDMKPENVLCITKNSNEIKLIDFGLARKYDPNQNFRVMFGTPEFVAPEVVNYDQVCHKTDMWSVGVICYILLSGLSPFMGEHDRETLVNVTMAQWDFEAEEFNDISEDAKDFIEGLLVKRKEKRMSAEECLSHKWLSQDVKYMRAKRLSTEKHKRFMARRKWQKTGNAIRALGRMASLQKAMGSLGQRSRGDSLGNATGKRSSGSQRPSRSSGPELVAECDENSSQDETTTLENEVSQTSIRVKQNNTPRNESSTKDNEPSFKSSATLSLSTNSLGTRVRGAETNGAANREIHNGRDDRNGRENGLSDRSMQLQTDMRRSLRPARSGIAPKFTKKMKDVEVIEGDIARFDVEFSGDPYPQLTWYKDGEEVQDSSHFVFEEEEGHHSLIIKDCMEEDDAEYECKIVNTAGKATCQGELYVAPLGENA